MRAWSREARCRGLSIGFVPTMGKLHEGHMALVNAARRATDRVVVSVFVNPTQFGAGEDFAAYPCDMRGDRRRCERAGADVLFAPPLAAMYREEPLTGVRVPALQDTLCGRSRPGHFDGVCLVVSKLLHIVEPTDLYLGRKDAQQALILTRMVRDLSMDVSVRVRPTVREKDGLALSSRNAYLDDGERRCATRLYQALQLGKSLVGSGERSASAVRRRMRGRLRHPVVAIEYVEVVDTRTLKPLRTIDREAMLAIAVRIGSARLIDNTTVRPRRARRRGRR